VLDERYAVFDVRLGDRSWAAIGEEACGRLTADTAGDALFDLLMGMAEQLDDGHTTLVADELGRDESAEVSEWPYYEQAYGLEDLVEATYLDAGFQTAAGDEISWGTIGGVGYISITSMDELNNQGIDDEDQDVASAAQAMAQALGDLAGSTGVIVDVRANEGGWDTVSLEIAAHFAGEQTVAWSEKVRDGPDHLDFAAPVDTEVEATRAGGYAGPVVLLTSGGTYSAAETFTLAMRVRDQVTVLGERGSGHLSDMIDHELPNGWELTYSGERYLAADGELYEVSGVPVDVEVPFDVAALAAGTDAMLEAALARLP
jgi:C-terminal processing protease CtpA/Prc